MKDLPAPRFDDFPARAASEWQEEIARQKGHAIPLTSAHEGIKVQLLYHERPGTLPVISRIGVKKPPITSRVDAPITKRAVEALHSDATDGAESITVVLDRAGRAARLVRDDVCADGLSLWTLDDLRTVLEPSAKLNTSLVLEAGSSGLALKAMCASLPEALSSCVSSIRHDILSDALYSGYIAGGFVARIDELHEALTPRSKSSHTRTRITVDARPIRESGGTIVQELAFVLSTTVQILRGLSQKGLSPGQLKDDFEIISATGSEVFLEIAKWRALRILWANLWKPFEVDPTTDFVSISSRWNRTREDSYTNQLRLTATLIGSYAGGVDRIELLPCFLRGSKNERFGRHLAISAQQVVAHESWLGAVRDPAVGSYSVEHLTCELAEHAWQLFQTHERAGGLFAILESGSLQREIKAQARNREDEFVQGRTIIVGLNKFRDVSPAESESEYDVHALREERFSACVEDTALTTPDFAALVTAAASGRGIAQLLSGYRQNVALQIEPLQEFCLQRIYDGIGK